MEWYWSLALILGALFTLLFVGVPVVFSFFAVNIVGMFLLMGGEAGLEQMVNSAYGSLTVFVLLPITLFVLMGEVMFRAGVAARMIDALDKWLGNLPGRLSLLAVASGTVLASLSGASIGTTAMLGATLAPELEIAGLQEADEHRPAARQRRARDHDPAERARCDPGGAGRGFGRQAADRDHPARHSDGGAVCVLHRRPLLPATRARAPLRGRNGCRSG